MRPDKRIAKETQGLTTAFRALLPAVLLATACAYPRPTKDESGSAITYAEDVSIDTAALYTYAEKETSYTVGAFDKLLVKVWRNDDLSGEIWVKEDGSIFVPDVGYVPLAGLTLKEAQIKLTAALTAVVRNPQIDLAPVEVRSKRFYLLGAVKNPGGYPIYKPLTVLEAVSLAGGALETAALEGAYLNRKGRVYPIDMNELFRANKEIYLTQGDKLYVPSRAEAVIYVLGEVAKPGAYPVSAGGLDVMQAVAQAGSYTVSADEDEIAIVRRRGDKFQLQVVNLEDAVKYAAGNPLAFRLRAGDIVWVPPMGIASWNRALAMITPTLDTFLFKPLAGGRDYFLIQDYARQLK
jgi:polysaccharide export outer membrane protein